MKTLQFLLIAVALVVFGVDSTLAKGKYSKYTADYYKALYNQYEGKEITVKVAFVKPYSCKSDIEGVQFFHAMTFDDKEEILGGEIAVAVPIQKVEYLLKKYGTQKDDKPKKLRGILTSDGRRLWFIDVDGEIKDMVDARRQVVMEERTEEAKENEEVSNEKMEVSDEAKKQKKQKKSHKNNGAGSAEPWWYFW